MNNNPIDVMIAIKNANQSLNEDLIAYKEDKGKAAKHFLGDARDLIEAVMVLIYNEDKGDKLVVTFQEGIDKASSYIRNNKKTYAFIWKLHQLIQGTRGHNTLSEDISLRLMTECYSDFIELKEYVLKRFGISVYEELDNFAPEIDNTYYNFYSQVSSRVDYHYDKEEQGGRIPGRFYVNKVKPIRIGKSVFYEVNLSNALDNTSKYDRTTVFSKTRMMHNYAVELYAVGDKVNVFENQVNITIVTGYAISIRPQELNSFYKLFMGKKATINSDWSEYKDLMLCLNEKNWTIYDLLYISEKQLQVIFMKSASHYFYDAIIKAREIVNNGLPGQNVIKYISFVMHNKLINDQLNDKPNKDLSGLYIKNGTIPFEKMPFAMNPLKHLPTFKNLILSIGAEGREHELLGRLINNNSNNNGILYTPLKKIEFDTVEELAETYNSNLFSGHVENSSIVIENEYVYINGTQTDCLYVLRMLREKSQDGVGGYQQSFSQWLDENPQIKTMYDEEKLTFLNKAFSSSKVAIISGPAGTGKTTMVKALTEYFNNQSFTFLTVTNTALDNLKRKVGGFRASYKTIYQFVKNDNHDVSSDVLVIDECSTVSNNDMAKVLRKAIYKLIVLIGDENQIEAINYGSWFKLAKEIMPPRCCCELKTPYRTGDKQLLKLWNDVRNKKGAVDAELTIYGYSMDINDPSIVSTFDEDEIILCLNYNGIYGINNINRFMQDKNKGKSISIRLSTFKINDPIIFNETMRYPELYNNLKGRIIGFKKTDGLIWFTVALEKAFTDMDFYSDGLEYLGTNNGKTNIKLFVREYADDNASDIERDEMIVPFNVSYAVSIHKSQGLEYNSVKVVIANDLEDVITHNIFYTAITRAKKYLHIYWSANTQKVILQNIMTRESNNDVGIIKHKLNQSILQ